MIPGQWPSCLFDICAAGPGVCIISFAMPCLSFGMNSEKLLRLTGQGESCCAAFSVYLFLWFFVGGLGIPLYCIPHCRVRGDIRNLNQIHSYFDLCITTCFFPCALIQEARLLSEYEKRQGGTVNPNLYPIGGGNTRSAGLSFLAPNNQVHPNPQPIATNGSYPQPIPIGGGGGGSGYPPQQQSQQYPDYRTQIITTPQPHVIYPDTNLNFTSSNTAPVVLSTPRRGAGANDEVRPFQTPQPATPATPVANNAQVYEAPREYRPVIQSPFQATAVLPTQPYYYDSQVAPAIATTSSEVPTTPSRPISVVPQQHPAVQNTPVAKLIPTGSGLYGMSSSVASRAQQNSENETNPANTTGATSGGSNQQRPPRPHHHTSSSSSTGNTGGGSNGEHRQHRHRHRDHHHHSSSNTSTANT